MIVVNMQLQCMRYLIIEFPSEIKSRTNEEQTNGKWALTAALQVHHFATGPYNERSKCVQPFSLYNNFNSSFLTTPVYILHTMEQGPQLVKKFPAFYGTRSFISACTRARQLSLFHSLYAIPLKSTLILPSIHALVFQVVSFPKASQP